MTNVNKVTLLTLVNKVNIEPRKSTRRGVTYVDSPGRIQVVYPLASVEGEAVGSDSSRERNLRAVQKRKRVDKSVLILGRRNTSRDGIYGCKNEADLCGVF